MPPDRYGRRPYSVHFLGVVRIDVAHQRDGAARYDVRTSGRRVVLLEEARCVGNQPFDANRSRAQERDGGAEAPVRLADGALVIDQRRLAFEGESEERRDVPVRERGSGSARCQHSDEDQNSE